MRLLVGLLKRILNRNAPRIAEGTVAGRRVLGTPSTVRNKPDYDDAWYFALAARHAKIMDVGANRGFTAMLALLAGDSDKKRVLLVDANAEALGVACQNLCLNDLGRRAIFHRGLVSDEVGKEVEFFTIGPGEAGSIYASHAKSAARQQQSSTLKTTTIDAIAAEHDFEPDLVKLDVEGAELDALKGAKRIAGTDALFFVEMHDLEARPMEKSARALIEWAEGCDRSIYYLKQHERLTDPKTIAHRGRCHLLILKNSRDYPAYLKPIAQCTPVTADLADN